MKKYIFLVSIILFLLLLLFFFDNKTVKVKSTSLVLTDAGKGKIILIDNEKNPLVEGVQGFCLTNRFFYGWSNNEKISYFVVELKDNSVQLFDSLNSMNTSLRDKGEAPLSMEKETTYWDIREGRSKICDTKPGL